MLQRTDFYPSRLDAPADSIRRTAPVVHSPAPERWAGPLDEQSLARFERDGYLWLEGFFSRDRLAPFLDELKELAKDRSLVGTDQVIKDKHSGELRSVFAMHEISPRFDQLTRDPRILYMIRQILGGDVYLHQSRINSKTGFDGGGFEWHSDFETWHAEDGMPEMRAVSASLMLTDNNRFNGPLMLIPGSHEHYVPCVGKTPGENWKQSLKDQTIGVPHRDHIAELAERGGIEAPTGPAGSLLLFDCNTLHASNKNMSPWPRANLFFVYNSVENQLVSPFGGTPPRPEFLGARDNVKALEPFEGTSQDDDAQHVSRLV